MKKVDILSVSGEVYKVIIKLGFLIDHLQGEHFWRQDTISKINAKVDTQTVDYNIINASSAKVEDLESHHSKFEEEYQTFEWNISIWPQIKELKRQIKDAKDRQDEIPKLDRQEMDEEIQAGF